MSATALISILSILALVLAFFLVVVKPESDKRKWRVTLLIALLLFCVSTSIEIVKYMAAKSNENAQRSRDLESRVQGADASQRSEQTNDLIRQLIATMNETMKDLQRQYEKLDQKIAVIPEEIRGPLHDELMAIEKELRPILSHPIHASPNDPSPLLKVTTSIDSLSRRMTELDEKIRHEEALRRQRTYDELIRNQQSAALPTPPQCTATSVNTSCPPPIQLPVTAITHAAVQSRKEENKPQNPDPKSEKPQGNEKHEPPALAPPTALSFVTQ